MFERIGDAIAVGRQVKSRSRAKMEVRIRGEHDRPRMLARRSDR
jgi:hypothetical protein